MDQDKIDRTIEIILQNQAQFHADMQKLQESQESSEKRINTLEKVSLNLVEAIRSTDSKLDKLTETVNKLTEVQKQTDEKMRETDDRLNAVILMVEKYLSNRNGNNN